MYLGGCLLSELVLQLFQNVFLFPGPVVRKPVNAKLGLKFK